MQKPAIRNSQGIEEKVSYSRIISGVLLYRENFRTKENCFIQQGFLTVAFSSSRGSYSL